MRRTTVLALAALALLSSCAQPAFAKHRHHHHASIHTGRHHLHSHHLHSHHSPAASSPGIWARPSEWCGWFMRRMFGVSNPAGNVALWWASYGSPASGPGVGRIVVWSHGGGHGHVGVITGKRPEGWVVKSGNDGNRVRERVRNVANAVAFREPR